jgi:hypothetical protein
MSSPKGWLWTILAWLVGGFLLLTGLASLFGATVNYTSVRKDEAAEPQPRERNWWFG